MKNQIIFIKSVFCPNELYFKTTYNSILNNMNYLKSYDIKIILVGWVKNEFIESIQKLNIEFIPWDTNYGKIHLYHSFNTIANNYKYILYADHDILFDNNKTNLNVILQKLDILFKQDFALIAFNQLEDCRHQNTLFDNIVEISDIKILISNTNNDIGGGCFIIKKIYMEYPQYNYVYGFDEKYLISCFKYQKCGVLFDYYIIHPFDNNDIDKKYTTWKKNEVKNNIHNFNLFNLTNYNNQIIKSHEFWKI